MAAELGLQHPLEELAELLGVLLDCGVKAELGDEVVRVDGLPVGELHDGEEGLEVGNDSLGLVLVVVHVKRLLEFPSLASITLSYSVSFFSQLYMNKKPWTALLFPIICDAC